MHTTANKAAEEDSGISYSRVREEDTVEKEDNVDDWGDDEEGWEYEDESDVYLRYRFFESWLWTDVSLPDEPDQDG